MIGLFRKFMKAEIYESEGEPVRLNAKVSAQTYDAILELQRKHARKAGLVLSISKIVDEAIKAYAAKAD